MQYYQSHIEEQLSEKSIDQRVYAARLETYNAFARANGADDFYITDVLNIFIALVQYPINFTVLKNKKVLFHFLHDKEHYEFFSAEYEKKSEEISGWRESESYELFNHCLSSEYRISVSYINSKQFEGESDYTIIKNTRSSQSASEYSYKPPSHIVEYIDICAQKFFEDDWLDFDTMLNDRARSYLEESIFKLAKTYKKGSPRIWPKKAEEIFQYQIREKINHPNSNPKTWNRKVDKLLTPLINDVQNNLRVFTSLTHKAEEYSLINASRPQPPNIFIAYRSYSRLCKVGDTYTQRHVSTKIDSSLEDGYAHNVHFCIPNYTQELKKENINGDTRYIETIDNRSPYHQYFNVLKDRFSKNWKESYQTEESGRVLYSRLFDSYFEDSNLDLAPRWKPFLSKLKDIALSADEKFWSILGDSSDGVDKIVEIMHSDVSNNSRSMVDSVFSSGLIHINPAFELAGLDRIHPNVIASASDFGSLDKGVQNDIMRIVSLYYYFSGSASWSTRMSLARDPRKISIVLLPLKMRGAVWGVATCAFYLEDHKTNFNRKNIWLSNFLLMTSGRRTLQQKIDSIFWANIQRRVSELIIRYIPKAKDAEEIVSAIEHINEKLKGEHLLIPYAIPQFWLEVSTDDSVGSEELTRDDGTALHKKWYIGKQIGVDHGTNTPRYVRLSWCVEESEFFAPRQPWSKRSMRSFSDAVEIAFSEAITELKRRLSLHE